MTVRSLVFHTAVRRASIAAAALFAAAPAAHAQWSTILRNPTGGSARGAGTAVYEWEGRVDQEIRVQLRDSRASIIRVGPRETIANNGRELSAIPREPGRLTVERLAGRGSIDVIQQPTASNGYSAVVRLVDNADGASTYHLIAYWQPIGGGDRAGNGTYGDDGRGGSANGEHGTNGGYDRDGYDRDGYDRNGRDHHGYDRNGYDRNGRDRRGDYRNGNRENSHGRGHAYGHDKQDQRDDRDDRKADKRDDKRDEKRDRKADKRDEKRDRKGDKRDKHDDDRDEHDDDRGEGRRG